MPTVYPGDPNTWANITAPVDGDLPIAESVAGGLRDLANRTANLRNGVVSFTGAKNFSNITSIGGDPEFTGSPVFSGTPSFNNGLIVNNGSFVSYPTIYAQGGVILAPGYHVSFPAREIKIHQPNFRIGGNFSWASAGGASFAQDASTATLLFMPVRLPHGSTWTRTYLRYKGPATGTWAPANKPTITLWKLHLTTGTATQIAGPFEDAPASTSAYRALHAFTTATPSDMNTTEVIDNDNYEYSVHFTSGGGAGSASGTQIYSLLTYANITQIDEG